MAGPRAWLLVLTVAVAAVGLVLAVFVVPRLPRPVAAGSVVWLCRPGALNDPCTANLDTTFVTATGRRTVVDTSPAADPPVDCFYVYPTVSTELGTNADLRVQRAEVAAAVAEASRFSQVCRVWAPMYRQVTLLGLSHYPTLNVPEADDEVAYASLRTAFLAYLRSDNRGRPIVFIGHSQGSAMLIDLLSRVVDHDRALRSRLLLAILPGGNVEVPTGKMVGATFQHLPLCTNTGEVGCVIAYSSFPHEPPALSLVGRPGQGVSLQSGQTEKVGVQVACVNPAVIGGGAVSLDPYFPTSGHAAVPWVGYPGLYRAQCETTETATWLNVTKATGATDRRPTVTESAGPDWGYHTDDVNLALGNLVDAVRAAEATWLRSHAGGGA